jgi:hypothetical protein
MLDTNERFEKWQEGFEEGYKMGKNHGETAILHKVRHDILFELNCDIIRASSTLPGETASEYRTRLLEKIDELFDAEVAKVKVQQKELKKV